MCRSMSAGKKKMSEATGHLIFPTVTQAPVKAFTPVITDTALNLCLELAINAYITLKLHTNNQFF